MGKKRRVGKRGKYESREKRWGKKRGSGNKERRVEFGKREREVWVEREEGENKEGIFGRKSREWEKREKCGEKERSAE